MNHHKWSSFQNVLYIFVTELLTLKASGEWCFNMFHMIMVMVITITLKVLVWKLAWLQTQLVDSWLLVMAPNVLRNTFIIVCCHMILVILIEDFSLVSTNMKVLSARGRLFNMYQSQSSMFHNFEKSVKFWKFKFFDIFI